MLWHPLELTSHLMTMLYFLSMLIDFLRHITIVESRTSLNVTIRLNGQKSSSKIPRICKHFFPDRLFIFCHLIGLFLNINYLLMILLPIRSCGVILIHIGSRSSLECRQSSSHLSALKSTSLSHSTSEFLMWSRGWLKWFTSLLLILHH